MPRFVNKVFNQLKSFGSKLLSGTQREFNRQVSIGKFDLDAKIQLSEFNDGKRGTKKAADWIKKSIKEGDYEFHTGIMESGKLYYFNYPNPKHKDTLEFYDAEPLVLCLGHYVSRVGDIIEIGINLHHLPIKVRRQVLTKVFEMFSRKYKGQLYRSTQKSVEIQWQGLAKPLLPYGAAFAFRSYHPKRRNECIEFKYEDWDKAIYVPSLKYVGISQQQLAAEWKQFLLTKSFTGLSANRLSDILGSY